MRIAYVAPYQGPTLLARRPVVRNRSMSNAVKIELIATLLHERSHEVELISQGEVVDLSLTFYPSLVEEKPFHPDIPVYYGSILPIRRLNGFWSNMRTLQLFKHRHRAKPYDLVIVFNPRGPQIACANYAHRRLGLPVVLEYEDDRFVNVEGQSVGGLIEARDTRAARKLLNTVRGCMAVSPHLLSQLPNDIPTLLLRGVVGPDIIKAAVESRKSKTNIVLFSGTHIASNGVAQLIDGWRQLELPDWQLHITGYGGQTEALRQMARETPSIVFHGLVSRTDLVRLMCSARICMNPHHVSKTPGNVFAFKLIEYLASGAHVLTTRMGALERDLETGITYMPDNSPATIATTIRKVIESRGYERTAEEAAHRAYGPASVSQSLDALLNRVKTMSAGN